MQWSIWSMQNDQKSVPLRDQLATSSGADKRQRCELCVKKQQIVLLLTIPMYLYRAWRRPRPCSSVPRSLNYADSWPLRGLPHCQPSLDSRGRAPVFCTSGHVRD
jgi:hypothetical protein